MRIVVTGAQGQLGRALLTVLLQKHTVIPLSHTESDITRREVIRTITTFRPSVIINAAAYTQVDRCGSDPRCVEVNVHGTYNLAQAAQAAHAELVHVSSNEVFAGDQTEPYVETDATSPINPYGASKLQGEQVAQAVTERLYIVRTAWLFNNGGNNFVHKIIAAARQHGALRVVDDEYGNPTYAPDLAQALAQLIETHHYGIYHFTNAGACSRYDYAQEILRLAGLGHIPIIAIQSSDWIRASLPPARAVLANRVGAALGITLRPWQTALADYFSRETP